MNSFFKIPEEKPVKQEVIEEQVEEIKELSLFDFIDALTYKKIPWEELGKKNQKKLQPYMLHKVFSMIPEFAEVLNEFESKKYKLSTEMIYKFWYFFLPKERFGYKYIKEKISEETKYNKELLLIFSKHFKESYKNIKDYLKILSLEDKLELLGKYGMSVEKSEKLLKVE